MKQLEKMSDDELWQQRDNCKYLAGYWSSREAESLTEAWKTQLEEIENEITRRDEKCEP